MRVWLRRAVMAAAMAAALLLAALETLRWSAGRQGVEGVPLPAGSEIARRARGADYADAYRVAVPRAGLDAAAVAAAGPQQGRELHREANEVVYEGGAPGLRFLISYAVEPRGAGSAVTVSTAVFYESPLGRLYFGPVGIGHRRLVPWATARLARALEDP